MTPTLPCLPGRRPGRAPATILAAIALPLAAALGAALPVAEAQAGGLGYGTTIVQERALLSLVDGRERIVWSPELSSTDGGGASERPAVVLPVPATPTVTALPGDQTDIFSRLGLATVPLPVDQDGSEDRAGADRAKAAVEVLSRATIGDYDVTRLRAGRADALRRWLDGHGYVTPERAIPVLQGYVEQDWAFVAIRLAEAPTTTAALRPLQISFPSRRLVYPMRLSQAAARPVSVELYVTGDHRVIASGFDSHHAGAVANLSPPLPGPVRSLVEGPFVTKLAMVRKDPATISGDVTIRQAVSDRSFRATADYPFESEAGFATAPLPSELQKTGPPPGTPSSAAWLLLFPAVGLLVGLTLLLLRLRDRLRD